MKQFIQDFKTGKLQIYEVPKPQLSKGMVLINNKFSLISAGTERTTVSTGQASLIGKAKKRPELVQQVLNNIKKSKINTLYHIQNQSNSESLDLIKTIYLLILQRSPHHLEVPNLRYSINQMELYNLKKALLKKAISELE